MLSERQIYNDFNDWVEACKKLNLIFAYKKDEIEGQDYITAEAMGAWSYIDKTGHIDVIRYHCS